jgi:hypothetical protein
MRGFSRCWLLRSFYFCYRFAPWFFRAEQDLWCQPWVLVRLTRRLLRGVSD